MNAYIPPPKHRDLQRYSRTEAEGTHVRTAQERPDLRSLAGQS